MENSKELGEKLATKEIWSSTDTDRESESNVTVDIEYKNMGWKRAAGLLFSEYICLAIMSFPWSYSILGLVPGLIITVFISLTVLYTGFTVTDYCILYPDITNVNDIGKHLFWNSNTVWWLTALCFVINNTLIQALHVLTGAKYFNTITDNYPGGLINVCSIVFAVLSMVICFLLSLPRTFSHMSVIGYFSAATMLASVVLSMTFAAVEDHPYKWTEGGSMKWYVWSPPHTKYVDAMSAFLNITYTFVGQITYPSFISQMKKPREFKKALVVVTILELITFALAGSIVYVYIGNEYITAPAFGSLSGNYKKIAFSLALPTILFLGSLYSNVTSQFLFEQIFGLTSKHRRSHTWIGWGTWAGLNFFLWCIAFVIAEVIPFFSDLLSLMSSLFDCWFGFVFWGAAYFRIRSHRHNEFSGWQDFKRNGWKVRSMYAINWFLIAIGFYMFGPGTYSTIQSIIWSYQDDAYGKPFTCKSNAI